MTETIGKVTLNLDKYPGEDYYCDGSVEDEILEIVKNTVPWNMTGSSQREKLADPVSSVGSAGKYRGFSSNQKTDKVLEVGSGCGAITGALSRKAGSVTCVDLSKSAV